MRSGWPTEDGHGIPPASQRHAPFGPEVSWPSGPEVSWPSGYSNPEYGSGGYRYPATRAEQRPASSQGVHPYASFNGSGYGDDGYGNPGYQGPVAQDPGIAGTRTVQGFVEPGQGQPGQGQPGYPPSGYARPGYPPAPAPQYQAGYAESSYAASDIEAAYPAAEAPHGADLYSQPWDYDQPLRYEGEEGSYQEHGRAGARGGRENNGTAHYAPAAYNGSDYSMPGINGPGYDLSGIIGTNDFEAVGYDEPSYRRLSYDDPRYDDAPRHRQQEQQQEQRFEDTRFDMRRFDETRLDELWLPGDDVRREGAPGGYSPGGHAESRSRSEAPGTGRGRRGRAAETRFDMKVLAENGPSTRFDMRALAEPGDNTRFDVPRFDETRLDNIRPLTPARGLRTSGAVALAPLAAKPRGWAEDTSLDHFADLDLTDEPVPAAFTRTLERPDSRPLELPLGQDDDTATRRAVGKRRGRSGDRRQWMALGAIAVVAAGAIGGVLMKYVFAGPSGPAHTIAAPQTVDGFSRSANLEKQLNVAGEAQTVAKESSGQATGVAYGVYQKGNLTPGSDTQMFMFVGGKLTGADPGASVTNFEQHYPGAKTVAPGSLGGQEACTETEVNSQSASMCVWFDNDTFGAVVSPTMTTANLATTMNTVRPSLESYQK